VHGLNLGADDYPTKPFFVEEFEARVRAMSRRLNATAAQLSVGGMNADVAHRRFTIDDRSIDLTPREWALLELFFTRPGRVLSKEQIAQGFIAFEGHLSANAVEHHVSRLRVKIESSAARIRTVRGLGYVWDSGDE